MAHSERIRKALSSYGISSHLRVTSAHKGPDETLRIKSEYEGKAKENDAQVMLHCVYVLGTNSWSYVLLCF